MNGSLIEPHPGECACGVVTRATLRYVPNGKGTVIAREVPALVVDVCGWAETVLSCDEPHFAHPHVRAALRLQGAGFKGGAARERAEAMRLAETWGQ